MFQVTENPYSNHWPSIAQSRWRGPHFPWSGQSPGGQSHWPQVRCKCYHFPQPSNLRINKNRGNITKVLQGIIFTLLVTVEATLVSSIYSIFLFSNSFFQHGWETLYNLKQFRKSVLTPTIYFYTLRYDLKSHHPVVVDIPLLQLFLVEVQDEGQVVVQIKL